MCAGTCFRGPTAVPYILLHLARVPSCQLRLYWWHNPSASVGCGARPVEIHPTSRLRATATRMTWGRHAGGGHGLDEAARMACWFAGRGASMSTPHSHLPDERAGMLARRRRNSALGAHSAMSGTSASKIASEEARWAVDARQIDDADLHSVGRTGSQPGAGPGCLFLPGRHPGAETGRSDASSCSCGCTQRVCPIEPSRGCNSSTADHGSLPQRELVWAAAADAGAGATQLNAEPGRVPRRPGRQRWRYGSGTSPRTLDHFWRSRPPGGLTYAVALRPSQAIAGTPQQLDSLRHLKTPEPSGRMKWASRFNAWTTDKVVCARMTENAVEAASAIVALSATTETERYRWLV